MGVFDNRLSGIGGASGAGGTNGGPPGGTVGVVGLAGRVPSGCAGAGKSLECDSRFCCPAGFTFMLRVIMPSAKDTLKRLTYKKILPSLACISSNMIFTLGCPKIFWKYLR